MFGLFKKKNKNIGKVNVLRKIEETQNYLSSNNVVAPDLELNNIKNMLDNSSVILTDVQVDCVMKQLDLMKSHNEKCYKSYLLNKCKQIKQALFDGSYAKDLYNNQYKNEDDLYEYEGELADISIKIKHCEEQMDKYLKTNPELWSKFNVNKKALEGMYQIKWKSYNALLQNESNRNMIQESQKAKESAKAIDTTSSKYNAEVFVGNMDYANEVDNEINENSTEIANYMIQNVGGMELNDEYQKALEEARLKEKPKEKQASKLQG